MSHPPAQAPIRLLCVDDEPAILRALAALFRAPAYVVYCAESGEQALMRLREQPIDVILCDMRMPRMDGLAVLREVRHSFPDCMRMVLSGQADSARVIQVVNEVGIYAYVNKPWDSADLQLKVHNAAEQRRLQQLAERQTRQLEALNLSLDSQVRERTRQLEDTAERLRTVLLGLGIPTTPEGLQVDEVRVLDTEELEPGMVVFESLLNHDGLLLLNAGQRLTQQSIDTLRHLERSEAAQYRIYVYDSPATCASHLQR